MSKLEYVHIYTTQYWQLVRSRHKFGQTFATEQSTNGNICHTIL